MRLKYIREVEIGGYRGLCGVVGIMGRSLNFFLSLIGNYRRVLR